LAQPRLPACADRALLFRREFCSWVRLLDLGQHLRELLDEPGMQHRIGGRKHAFRADFSGGRAKERQQFGGPSSLVLMWVQGGMPFPLPRGPTLCYLLIVSPFVFIEL